MRFAQLALIASVCGGLAAAALADAPAPSPAAATLPTPYTAEQIREAWQPGFSVEMRTTGAGAETRSRMTVLSATPEAGVVRRESFAASGKASEPPNEFSASWSELRDHALFEAAKARRATQDGRLSTGAAAPPQQGARPRRSLSYAAGSATQLGRMPRRPGDPPILSRSPRRERAECRSQLGLMPGWRYIVPEANGDTLTMCFADATPGPPVEYETLRGGAVGSRTEHVNYGRPQGGAAEGRGQ